MLYATLRGSREAKRNEADLQSTVLSDLGQGFRFSQDLPLIMTTASGLDNGFYRRKA